MLVCGNSDSHWHRLALRGQLCMCLFVRFVATASFVIGTVDGTRPLVLDDTRRPLLLMVNLTSFGHRTSYATRSAVHSLVIRQVGQLFHLEHVRTITHLSSLVVVTQ